MVEITLGIAVIGLCIFNIFQRDINDGLINAVENLQKQVDILWEALKK